MFELLLVASGIHQMWYAAPLIVTVSLVYAATRHESMQPILLHALRFGGMITLFMSAVLAVLLMISWAVSN